MPFSSTGLLLLPDHGAIYAERRSVRKLIFVCLILWGACASLTGVVNNIPAAAAIRFILGVVEAAVMPTDADLHQQLVLPNLNAHAREYLPDPR